METSERSSVSREFHPYLRRNRHRRRSELLRDLQGSDHLDHSERVQRSFRVNYGPRPDFEGISYAAADRGAIMDAAPDPSGDGGGEPERNRGFLQEGHQDRLLYFTYHVVMHGTTTEELRRMLMLIEVVTGRQPDLVSDFAQLIPCYQSVSEIYGFLRELEADLHLRSYVFCSSCCRTLSGKRSICDNLRCALCGVRPKRSKSQRRAALSLLDIRSQLMTVLTKHLSLLISVHRRLHDLPAKAHLQIPTEVSGERKSVIMADENLPSTSSSTPRRTYTEFRPLRPTNRDYDVESSFDMSLDYAEECRTPSQPLQFDSERNAHSARAPPQTPPPALSEPLEAVRSCLARKVGSSDFSGALYATLARGGSLNSVSMQETLHHCLRAVRQFDMADISRVVQSAERSRLGNFYDTAETNRLLVEIAIANRVEMNLLLAKNRALEDEVDRLKQILSVKRPLPDTSSEFKYENLRQDHLIRAQPPFKEVNLNEFLRKYAPPKRVKNDVTSEVIDFLRTLFKEICAPDPSDIWNYAYRVLKVARRTDISNLPDSIVDGLTEFILDALDLNHNELYGSRLHLLKNSQNGFWLSLAENEQKREKVFNSLLEKKSKWSVSAKTCIAEALEDVRYYRLHDGHLVPPKKSKGALVGLGRTDKEAMSTEAWKANLDVSIENLGSQ